MLSCLLNNIASKVYSFSSSSLFSLNSCLLDGLKRYGQDPCTSRFPSCFQSKYPT